MTGSFFVRRFVPCKMCIGTGVIKGIPDSEHWKLDRPCPFCKDGLVADDAPEGSSACISEYQRREIVGASPCPGSYTLGTKPTEDPCRGYSFSEHPRCHNCYRPMFLSEQPMWPEPEIVKR